MNNPSVDPTTLSLADLRELRSQQQAAEDAISYVRRLVQARLDLVSAEQKRRNNGNDRTVSDDLPAILGRHLNSGPARPPRPTVEFDSDWVIAEVDGGARWARRAAIEMATQDGRQIVGHGAVVAVVASLLLGRNEVEPGLHQPTYIADGVFGGLLLRTQFAKVGERECGWVN